MPEQIKDLYDFGPFRADAVRRVLLRDNIPVPLTSKAFDTLEVLLRNRDRVMEKEELLKAIWPDSFVEEANLTQNVSTLRKALCELPGEHRYIATVPGRGYRFVGEVREQPPEPPAEAALSSRERKGSRLAVAVIALVLAGVAVAAFILWRRRQAGESAPPQSLAVLPFRQLTALPGEEYFGVGLADAVITRLSNVRELVVRPTDAVLRYAGSPADPVAAGRELKVEAVLTGSVQQAAGRIRVTVQLNRVADGRPLWAETFDETPAGLFDVEDSVSSQVAETMVLHLGGAEKAQLARHYTENVEAWRDYLQGRYAEFQFTREGMDKAIEHFHHALALDPGYAIAWAGLADAYTTASDWVLPPREALPKAEAAARKALSFDDRLAEAHGSLGHALMHEWRLKEAGSEFQRALSLNPNNTSIYFAWSEYLSAVGRYDEGVAELKKARQLDPLSPALPTMVSWCLYLKGDYAGAVQAADSAIGLDSGFWFAYMENGYNWLALGRYSEAIAQFEKAISLNPESTISLSGLAGAYARAGRRDEALAVIARMNDMSKRQYVAPVDYAFIYAALGERDRALEYLQRGYADQSEMMLYLKLYGQYAGLRDDPRFRELERRVRPGS